MDPLTHDELDYWQDLAKSALNEDFPPGIDLPPNDVIRLIAAARSSLPRPISEAPRDGMEIERCPHCGYTEDDKRFHLDHHLCDAKNARGPIPKGGAS